LAPLLFNITDRCTPSLSHPAHAHADDMAAVIKSRAQCNQLLEVIRQYELASGASLNKDKTAIIAHPLAPKLSSPFRNAKQERYLGVLLRRGGTLKVLSSTMDKVFALLGSTRRPHLSLLGRMNILQSYIRPTLLFALAATKDSSALNRMAEWERWYLSPGNSRYCEQQKYRNIIAPERLHPLNWGHLPPLPASLDDRRQNLAARYPKLSPFRWNGMEVEQTRRNRRDAPLPLTKGQETLTHDIGVDWRLVWVNWKHLPSISSEIISLEAH